MHGGFRTLGALLLTIPLTVSAQEAGRAGPEEQAAPAELEAGDPPHFAEEVTVTVTARKREEDLQSVPFSVVAPTQRALRNRGAESIEDVSANVAGFSVQNLGPGQSQIAMRGVSAGQTATDRGGCDAWRIQDARRPAVDHPVDRERAGGRPGRSGGAGGAGRAGSWRSAALRRGGDGHRHRPQARGGPAVRALLGGRADATGAAQPGRGEHRGRLGQRRRRRWPSPTGSA